MKRLFIFSLVFLSLLSCNKDDDQTQTIEEAINKLPAATQTGEGTFACLVNGKPFIADNAFFNCYYQYVDGGYYFSIQGRSEQTFMRTVILGTTDKTIIEGEELLLTENKVGNSWAGGRIDIESNNSEGAYTNSLFTGKLLITKFNKVNYIVSGTFSFDIKHPETGDTIKIRNGRFDTLFYP